ncbi:hypothetical protein [Variovorax paradoxus]|uniref:hypothetical protein n=1 Tax=Variovorax paradoxus TaxID=34073 RepID=UPI003ECEC161
MFALEPVIVERLRAALGAAWTVKGYTSDDGNRDAFPFASVFFGDGNIADNKTSALAVQPGWRVSLVARTGEGAAELLDAAFSAAIASLHNWAPGSAAGRRWARMFLVRFAPPQYADAGLTGVELLFSTTAQYRGQD